MSKSDFLRPFDIHGPFDVDLLGEVYIREVPYSDAGFVYHAQSGDTLDTSLRIIVVSVCDKNGDRLFTDEDYDMLRKVPAARLQPVMELVTEHSGFGASVEDIAGN